MIAIAGVIAAATAVGFGVEHRWGEERSQRAAIAVMNLMLWVLLPKALNAPTAPGGAYPLDRRRG